MSTKEEEFLKELQATFALEAGEHVQAIATGLLELEKSPAPDAQRRVLQTVFRAAHSLKGAARAVDCREIESMCQLLEDKFAAWKRQATPPSRDVLDTVHRTLDGISAALAAPGVSDDVGREASRPAEPTPAHPAASAAAPAGSKAASHDETVRISVARLDARLLEAEEMLTAKLAAGQRANDLRELATRCGAWKREWTAIEPEMRALRQLVEASPQHHAHQRPSATHLTRLLEILESNRDHVQSLERRVAALSRTADQERQLIGRLVDDLLEHSKKLLLLPFATLTAPFPKLVRDLCREQGKEADLVIRGEEVEIDKRILEAMKPPLIHLLRNAIDHGLEKPEQRVRTGKSPQGTVTLAASQIDGNNVQLMVSDDGAGISVARVKESAIERGVLSADDVRQLDEAQAQRLIFEPELSTSPIITRLSGRGLGLAIVREAVEALGGTVTAESQPGQGTHVRIVLPSTLATFRGIVVEAARQLFVVPTSHVERVARVKPEAIRTVEGHDTVTVSGRAVAVVRLSDVLELPAAESSEAADATLMLVLSTADQRIGFAVDAVVDEQEVLVKPLRKPLSRVRNVAGSTVLGSGQVAPVLNASDLIKSARKTGSSITRTPAHAPSPREPKSILVVEDSITSRMLIKSILEAAGYNVKVAVDGLEAFNRLRVERFDLVVSDVEMPRLNGFDLTARVRADAKLAELPIVLVTALETPEDREHGIDVGADAYIVKSSFDQSDLLDAVRRLA